jgi:hypothetical protein
MNIGTPQCIRFQTHKCFMLRLDCVTPLMAGVHIRNLVWENGHWLVLDGTGALYKVSLPEVCTYQVQPSVFLLGNLKCWSSG